MSKINPHVYEIIDLDMSRIKKALKVVFKINELSQLIIIGIHLTSDTHKNSKSTRIQQISKIIDKINLNESCVILGDTNETDSIKQLSNFSDSNNSIINTYNPKNNIFAKHFSSKGICCRYDIIFHNKLECKEFNVIENNSLSDHYPIIGLYDIRDDIKQSYSNKIYLNKINSQINLTHKTSLCIIPPWKISKQIPIYNDRWMPHINLFWGFVFENEFNKYHSILSQITNKTIYDKIESNRYNST